jgi:hypothetical protein
MANADRSPVPVLDRSAGRRCGAEDGPKPHPHEEDHVTESGTPIEVPEADRAEQEALVDPPAVVTAADAAPPPEDVPEADGIEQQLDALPRAVAAPSSPVGDREADDADVLEQETDVPLDDDDVLS